jgi:hypothetical protein
MEIHLTREQSKMGAQPKSGVVDIEIADSSDGAHRGVHARDQIGERPSVVKADVSQPRCCCFERGRWNPPLM